MDIIIATNNKHKVEEYKELLKDFKDINIISLKEAGIVSDPIEDGTTFEANSLIKAKACQNKTDKIIIADDSGLIVDALPNILGVGTSRFMGEDTSYDIKRKEVIRLLENKDRSARFVCCITLINFGKEPVTFKGEVEGWISYKVEGEYGFGYDPIFIPNGYDKTFASLGEDVKGKISHRAKASVKLVEYLKEHLR